MNAIEERLKDLKEKGEGALIAYVCGGDPTPEDTPRIVDALIRGGANMIELGIPFSDPIADGPTIQDASVRALRAGTTPTRVIEMAREVKEKHPDVPLALMTYYNPIYHMGTEKFINQARESEIDGIIVPDLPVEEADEYKRLADAYGMSTIFMVAPNTTEDRLETIIDNTTGFLYLVSTFGVTGTRETIQDHTLETLNRFLPLIDGRIPLAVGFGISKPEHVRTIIGCGADGAIVGSAFVETIGRHQDSVERMTRALEMKASELTAGTRIHPSSH